jgi:hypothetical protein
LLALPISAEAIRGVQVVHMPWKARVLRWVRMD